MTSCQERRQLLASAGKRPEPDDRATLLRQLDEPACHAVALLRSRFPDLAVDKPHRLQEGLYVRSADITDPDTVVTTGCRPRKNVVRDLELALAAPSA